VANGRGFETMNLYSAIEKRISIRKYENEILDEQVLFQLLEKLPLQVLY
jgi:hypothetical protein